MAKKTCTCKDYDKDGKLIRFTIMPSNTYTDEDLAKDLDTIYSMPCTLMMDVKQTQEQKDNIDRVLNMPKMFFNSIEELAEYQEKMGHNKI